MQDSPGLPRDAYSDLATLKLLFKIGFDSFFGLTRILKHLKQFSDCLCLQSSLSALPRSVVAVRIIPIDSSLKSFFPCLTSPHKTTIFICNMYMVNKNNSQEIKIRNDAFNRKL